MEQGLFETGYDSLYSEKKFYGSDSDDEVLSNDNGFWSDSSADEVATKDDRNRRSPTEENELLKTALANSISTLKTLQSQLEESIKLSKKLKSKKTMLDFDLVKTTAKELHREVIEAVLTTEKSAKLAQRMLQQVSTSSNPLLFGYSNDDSIDNGTLKEEETPAPPQEDRDPKKLIEVIRRLNAQNISLETKYDQLNEQYQISKDQIRELHLTLRHTNKSSRDGILQTLEAREGNTRRFNDQISESTGKIHILEETIQQLQLDIKNHLADFRNKEKHYKKQINQLKTQFEEDKMDILRGCKAEIESIQDLKQKEVSDVKLEFEQLKISLERTHQKQIAELKREAIIQSKKLNKKLSELKLEIEKQRKVAKVDAIRMQETIQAAKVAMVRKTFGESSDEDSDEDDEEENETFEDTASEAPSENILNDLASQSSMIIYDSEEKEEEAEQQEEEDDTF